MLVRFQTKAYPPITMFGDVATELLRLMGMSTDVPGAIEGRDVGQALARLRSGLARLGPDPAAAADSDDEDDEPAVSLTVRAFPLLELMSLAAENGHHVMWTEKRTMTGNRATGPAPERPGDPAKLLAREDLTVEDKVALLKDWQLDLTERMTATDENMSPTRDESRTAEQLREVARALSILDRQHPG